MANETKHVIRAFLERVKDQLGDETTIDYPGTKFDTGTVTEWIRPRTLGYTPISESGTQTGFRREAWTFSVDVMVKVGLAGETTHRVHELVDLLKAALDRHTLSVLDYSDDKAEEAQCYLGRADVTPVEERSEGQYILQHMNCTWEGVLWA